MKDFALFFEQVLTKSKCEIKNYLLSNYFVAKVIPIPSQQCNSFYPCKDLTSRL
jgi:hypothetical protein